MKFDEEKWRYLAANKPDELHSYIPQSSINELFDEIERLEKENFKLKEANEDVQSRLDDYRQDYATVVNDQCPTDERHCGCVPILRRENRILSEDLANAKDELKHRRDALVDAQNIYNDIKPEDAKEVENILLAIASESSTASLFKAIRKIRKLSMSDVSEISGVNRNTIGSIENGNTIMTARLKTLCAISRALKCDLRIELVPYEKFTQEVKHA